MSSVPQNKVVFILGPTAVGKSSFALKAAQKHSAALVNCDSLQVFKDLNIGTAKPTEAEFEQCKHLLFNIVGLDQEFTAGEYRRQALEVIDAELPKQPLFFVGGSGFYIQALDKGMFDVGPIDKKVSDLVEEIERDQGVEGLYRALYKVDSEYAEKVGAKDAYRLFRGLNLVLSENKSMQEIEKDFAEKRSEQALKVPKIKIGLRCDRELLRERVRERVQQMLSSGLVGEVEGLLSRTQVEDWAPLRSVGYKEVIEFLHGEKSEQWLEDEVTKNTMRLAKRQMTWFRRDPEIHWFDYEEGLDKPLSFLDESL